MNSNRTAKTSDRTAKPSRRRALADTITAILVLLVFAWALVPGIGPDLLGIEARTGWRVSAPWQTSAQPIGEDVTTALGKLRVRASQYESNRRYHRTSFGEVWADEDHNGCDTRDDVLARDMSEVTYKTLTRRCKVASGTLAEPYTGKIIHFKRGPKTSPLVQIDHVVALGDAWRSGAYAWDAAKRQRYANDPLVLLATDGQANQDKGSMAADQWLPPDHSYHCAYVARQIAIKSKWNLSVTGAEKTTFQRVLRACPGQHLPQDLGQIHP